MSKSELQDQIHMTMDALAGRIFAALPADDPDCLEAFHEWRELTRQIFDNPEISPRELSDRQQAAFETLAAQMKLAGVKTI